MREKILNLLGHGHPPQVVALAVGCEPSYVSQLMSEDQFALEVAKLRCGNLEELTTRDAKYDSLEDRLLEKLDDLLPFMMKPRDVLDALTRINAAKRRGVAPVLDLAATKTTIIALQLPQVIHQHFSINGQGEVMEVGDRALVNMPAALLMKSLEARSLENAEKEQPRIPNLSSKQAERAVITVDSI
jgi:hypothetical protein